MCDDFYLRLCLQSEATHAGNDVNANGNIISTVRGVNQKCEKIPPSQRLLLLSKPTQKSRPYSQTIATHSRAIASRGFPKLNM